MLQARTEREPERSDAVEGQLPVANGTVQPFFRSEYSVGRFARRYFHVAQPLESRPSPGSHGTDASVRFQRRPRPRRPVRIALQLHVVEQHVQDGPARIRPAIAHQPEFCRQQAAWRAGPFRSQPNRIRLGIQSQNVQQDDQASDGEKDPETGRRIRSGSRRRTDGRVARPPSRPPLLAFGIRHPFGFERPQTGEDGPFGRRRSGDDRPLAQL